MLRMFYAGDLKAQLRNVREMHEAIAQKRAKAGNPMSHAEMNSILARAEREVTRRWKRRYGWTSTWFGWSRPRRAPEGGGIRECVRRARKWHRTPWAQRGRLVGTQVVAL